MHTHYTLTLFIRDCSRLSLYFRFITYFKSNNWLFGYRRWTVIIIRNIVWSEKKVFSLLKYNLFKEYFWLKVDMYYILVLRLRFSVLWLQRDFHAVVDNQFLNNLNLWQILDTSMFCTVRFHEHTFHVFFWQDYCLLSRC